MLLFLLACDADTAGRIASEHALALSPAPTPCIAAARARGKCEWRLTRTSAMAATRASVSVRWTDDGETIDYEAQQYERDGRRWVLTREW